MHSETFCKSRMIYLCYDLQKGLGSNCCHIPVGAVQLSEKLINVSPSEIRSTTEMVSGRKPKECRHCWELEEKNFLSPRQKRNRSHSEVIKHKELFERIPFGSEDRKTTWLNLVLSNKCQFKCLYCSPAVSSSWLDEIEKNGNLYTWESHGLYTKPDSRIADSKLNLEFFLTRISEVSYLDINGGEPLLDPQLMKILDHIFNFVKHDFKLVIITNLSVAEVLWCRFLEKIRGLGGKDNIEIVVQPSVDCWGERAEYIRRGLNFELFQKRVLELLNLGCVHVNFSITANVFSMSTMPNLLKWILDLKIEFQNHRRWIGFRLEPVTTPYWLGIGLVKFDNLKDFEAVLDGFEGARSNLTTSKSEISQIANLLSALRKNHPSKQNIEVLRKFISEVDLRFKSNFSKTFPEYEFAEEEVKIRTIEPGRNSDGESDLTSNSLNFSLRE